MPLKAVLADRAAIDALPEAVRGLYVEKDGKFILDADVEDHPAVAGLKSALGKERDERSKTTKDFQRLKDQVGDLDPEKAREAMRKLDEMASKKLLDEGQIEEYVRTKTEAMKNDHSNQIKAFNTQLEDGKKRVDTLTGRLKTLVLDGGIRDRAIEKGVKPEHVDDVLLRMTVRGIDGVKWDLQDEKIVALAGDQVKYGKDASQPMSIDEGLELLRAKVPGFFQPSSGSGAAGSQRAGVQGSQYVISRADAKDIHKYTRAKDEAAKAGIELVIAEA